MNTDIFIVGTGVGGLFAALNLPRDKKILMITFRMKIKFVKSNA